VDLRAKPDSPALLAHVDKNPGACFTNPLHRLVQLGAFDSRDEADAVWSSLSASYYDYFALHPKVVEEATANGKTFYRLRAFGFDDLAAAQNFCAMLVAAKVDCIPVLTQ